MTWDVVGQERAVAVLRRAVEDEGRLSHAYLFAGPEQVGKATTARRFAQALNCEREEPPCNECRACRLIAEDKHPDVEWVLVGGVCDESEHRDHAGSRDIRVCQVRRLQRVVSLTPFEGRYRVIVLDPADGLTAEAANAFLKTLEEPPPHVVLILITSREEALRETVRSRCRRIGFTGVPRGEIEAALRERWGADADQAAQLSGMAQGRLGWAVSVLQDETLLDETKRIAEEIPPVLAGGFEERFAYANALGAAFVRDPQSVRTTLETWRAWWRDVFLAAAGQEELVLQAGGLDSVRSQASQCGVEGAMRALAAVSDAARQLEEHASPTLALEVMLLEMTPGTQATAG